MGQRRFLRGKWRACHSEIAVRTCEMKKRELYDAILSLKDSIEFFGIRTERRFDAMDARFDATDGRMDRMSDRMSRLETRIESVEDGVAALRVDVTEIKERLVRVEQR